MILRIDHLGIAVRSLEARLPFWSRVLGLEVSGIESVAAEQVKVAFLPVGDSRVELLEPTAGDSAVARFLERRGEGIHHVTFAVDDLALALERLRGAGVEVPGDVRAGAEGRRVAFLHPRSTGGVLLELVESPAAPPRASELGPGSAVLVYLREPQEKLWGVLQRLDSAGALLEAIDLGSFDDWVAQLEREEESVVGPSLVFVPMLRLERVVLDRASGHLPSLAQRFERRVGRTVQQVVREQHEAGG